jgi:hypothetical protein
MSDPALDVPPDVADQDDVLSIDEIDDYADVTAPGSVLHSLADKDAALAVHAAHGWQIGTTRQAEWAMAQIRAAELQLAEIDDQADERIMRIHEWRDRVSGRLERRRAVLEGKLLDFARRWHETDPKTNRTLILPSGEVKTRQHRKGTVVVSDEQTALAWVHAARRAGMLTPDQAEACYREEVKVFVSELRKHVAATRGPDGGWIAVDAGGEPVPGMDALPPADTDIGPVKPYTS